jgi:hypothetical protein
METRQGAPVRLLPAPLPGGTYRSRVKRWGVQVLSWHGAFSQPAHNSGMGDGRQTLEAAKRDRMTLSAWAQMRLLVGYRMLQVREYGHSGPRISFCMADRERRGTWLRLRVNCLVRASLIAWSNRSSELTCRPRAQSKSDALRTSVLPVGNRMSASNPLWRHQDFFSSTERQARFMPGARQRRR